MLHVPLLWLRRSGCSKRSSPRPRLVWLDLSGKKYWGLLMEMWHRTCVTAVSGRLGVYEELMS